ncbi:cadmium-translocating P-type ATPase [Cetobacterium somerae]|uniref:heavy metal translocating P-type ATPase n=1 Tax=Cetobacterium somerae TaxID=188913 RepID=UPI00211F0493|nr:heavy metal translocating P-type ATPase [Cetobacterium somerae]MCQ9628346.1 cadmium-translocating P-type ATPase [Cetobacterium somerae]
MFKKYYIKNLHCGGCASKIQYEFEKISFISDVNLNFYTKTFSFTLLEKEKEKNLLNYLNNLVNSIEEGVFFEEKIDESEEKESLTSLKNSLLVFGMLFFFVGFFIKDPIYKNTVFFIAYILSGYDILIKAVKNIFKGKFLDENFLMSIATVGAIFLRDFSEAAGVMIFFKVGDFFQELAINNSKKSIKALMKIKPEFANLKKNGIIKKVSPEDVYIDDIIIIKPGERIPLDGVIIKGSSTIDNSALTGESLPILADVGSQVSSGGININGVIEMKVEKIYSQSTVNKILEMVEQASNKKSVTEKYITKFARYYTPLVVILSLIIAFIFPMFLTGGYTLWIKRALIFLVISCPCALVLSVPLTFFSSIGKASKEGILIKGSNYLDGLKNIGTVVFDKTGTLTKGKFKVTEIKTFNSFTEEQVLNLAQVAEYHSNHPIAKAIMEAKKNEIIEEEILEYMENPGYGISVLYRNMSILVGNKKYMNINKINIPFQEESDTTIYVANNLELAGCITVNDEVKKDALQTIKELEQKGIESYMLTGDNKITGSKIGKSLGLKEHHIFTQLLPKDKVDIFKKIKQMNKKGVIFVGDGINDAPVLALSDIGISMGKLGSDIAIESSDIVLMNDNPYQIVKALDLSQFTNKIVIQNVTLALSVKGVVMILGIFGIVNLWLAIFADVGVSIIAILNASRILKSKI